MYFESFGLPLIGGGLIGLSASLLLLFKGRILGVSGILAGALIPKRGDTAWRFAALAGFASAGFLLLLLRPDSMIGSHQGPDWQYLAAGILVGFGTQLGSGCTSGHAVCGISRLSPRSIVATLTFILSGMITVTLIRAAGGIR